MDITETIAASSEQVNADDIISPRVVTITGVSRGTDEQPVNIELAEFPGRAYRPCKSMRRVLVAAWGTDASSYIGHQIMLYNDRTVKWGGQAVGGLRIKALSHISEPLKLPLTVTRGKRALFTVEPLPSMPPEIIDFEHRVAEADSIESLDAIAAELKGANLGEHRARLQNAWSARKQALKSAPAADDDYGDLLDAAAEGVAE